MKKTYIAPKLELYNVTTSILAMSLDSSDYEDNLENAH